MWDRETGKIYANIEAEADFNDLCHYKDSGLFFMTNDQPKIQVEFRFFAKGEGGGVMQPSRNQCINGT